MAESLAPWNSRPHLRLIADDPASCPGGIKTASPGPTSPSAPSSNTTCMQPVSTEPTCGTWQLVIPAWGLTCSDQLDPGSKVVFLAERSPKVTISPVVVGRDRVSSDVARLFFWQVAIGFLLLAFPTYRC